MTHMNRRALIAAVFAASLSSVSTVQAADYPDRPISVMVSYGAGGATDFQARIVTMVAGNEEYLGQPMVIINKPGAGGRVGWNWFASEAVMLLLVSTICPMHSVHKRRAT